MSVGLPAGRIVISTTAVTVTVGKKTAIAGGKGHFFSFFFLMHPAQLLFLMTVWYYKSATNANKQCTGLDLRTFAFLLPTARRVCSGPVRPSVTEVLIFHYYIGKRRLFGFRHLCATDLCVFGVLIMRKLRGRNRLSRQKQTGLSALRRFGRAALWCENHVIFGNEK